MLIRQFTLLTLGLMGFLTNAAAQSTDSAQVSFGGIKADTELPVTVTSETLSVDQTARLAIFQGDVLVIQGEMRLTADKVHVIYAENEQRPEKLLAFGNVILVNAIDSAASDEAEYIIKDGLVTMWENVVLTQGELTFSAPKLVADLKTGLGMLEGGVTSVFTPAETAP